jgi:hypothetical protein
MYHYFYKALDVAATEQALGAWPELNSFRRFVALST